jgi:hypothetical protein
VINTGWTYDVDVLAQNGIIDHDAAAYLLNTPARFAGPNPAVIPPLMPQKSDQFVRSNPQTIPTWKKVLTAGLVAALAIFGVKKVFKI